MKSITIGLIIFFVTLFSAQAQEAAKAPPANLAVKNASKKISPNPGRALTAPAKPEASKEPRRVKVISEPALGPAKPLKK